tara:strand:+ start:254 stop:634 length:381 start_codon:yes stop_codon:yes gene_type:complete
MYWAKHHECIKLKNLLKQYGYDIDIKDKVSVKDPVKLNKRITNTEKVEQSIPSQYNGSWCRGVSINKQNKDISHRCLTDHPVMSNRCKAIKLNDKQCRQMNNPNQSGGEIIDGYCEYHKHLRRNNI